MKYYIYILACLCAMDATSQVDVINLNQAVKISAGTTLFMSGSLTNDSAGTITNNGEIKIRGNTSNKGTFSSSGRFAFIGTSNQNSDMNGATLDSVWLEKNAAQVTLLSPLTISGQLTFTGINNYIQLGANNLSFGNGASIIGADASNFIITNDTGNVLKPVGTGTSLFPVGVSNSNYTPLSISNSGTADILSVRVADSVYTAYSNRGLSSGPALNQGREINTSWIVNEQTQGGSNLSITASWFVGEEGNNFDRSNSVLTYFSGGSWAGGSFSAATGANPYSQTINNFTNTLAFTPFGVGGHPASPLPIKLIDFTAIRTGNDVLLEWTTASEINIKYYEPERSINGKDWVSLGKYISPTYNTLNYYTEVDKQIFANDNTYQNFYYRIKILEEDGSINYSPTRVLASEKAKPVLLVFPNPTSGFVTLISGNQMSYKVYDSKGSLLIYSDRFSTSHQLDLNALSQGIYVIELLDESGFLMREKVIVSR